MTHPDCPYFVCATPRSGSTLLGELLTATGVAGRPQEHFERLYATNQPRQPREYFDGVADPSVLEALPPRQAGTPESAEAFEARLRDVLRDGATDNGVWASRLMWGFFLDFLRRLRERPDTAALRSAEAIEHLLPGVRYVQIKRRNKVPQAVSLWTSLQSEPVYSYAAIKHLLGRLTAQDQAWASWFGAARVEPIVLFYEDLVADPRGVVGGLLRSLHIDTHFAALPDNAPDPAARGTAGWVERYEHERRALVAA